jgi:hypothetical protein
MPRSSLLVCPLVTRALYHPSCFIYLKSVILFKVSMWGDHVNHLHSHPANTVRSGEEPCQGRDERRAGVWGGWALHTALYVTVWDGRQTKCSICATSLKTRLYLSSRSPPPPRPSENPKNLKPTRQKNTMPTPSYSRILYGT